jgi:prolyl oligopeptidase
MDGHRFSNSIVQACLLLCAYPAYAQDLPVPVTPQLPVTEAYHATSVTDPYRWLENTQDPKVHAWSLAQDARTRRYLDALPQRAPLHAKLLQQIAASSSHYDSLYAVAGHVFARYTQPPKQQPMIAVLDQDADPAHARVVVDPNAINPRGTTAIDWFVPSPDGRLVAVSMSENGSEDGTLRLYDVASGRETGTRISRVQYPTAGGSLAWRADSKAFWYTRYPGIERPASDRHFYQQVFLHRLDAPVTSDTYVLGKGLPKVAEIKLDTHANPNLVMVEVANGDGGEFQHYLIDAGNAVTQLTRFADQVVDATIGADGAVYLISRKGAPRGELLRLDPGVTTLDRARRLVAQSDAVMLSGGQVGGQPLTITDKAIYIRELVGGPSRVAIYDRAGAAKGTLPLPDVAAVEEVEALADGSLLYSIETYLHPAYFARYDEAAGRASDTGLAQTSPVSFDDAEVLREFATSKDGTKVPINIVRRKGTPLNGRNPTLLYGYGGYSLSETPHFLGPMTRAWLDAGGVYVIANLRGGSEFGETWHQQGMLTHKQNVFDDFYAAGRYLVDARYTDKDHLAILGGSNGGLLMGAELTQHPEAYRAVVSRVGLYDMLRSELDPNGAFNVSEYGSVKDPQQFAALYAYSPYHHVEIGTAYPAIFMATGETDGRVNPAHSRKMIARLQAATRSGRPVYLSINAHAGHGIGSALDIRVNQLADWLSFLFDQLGMH